MGVAFALVALAAAPQALAAVHLDRSFGRAGTLVPQLPPTWESSGFSELAAQADGGVIVKFEPVAVNSYAAPGMRRYLGDGSPDPSYAVPSPPFSPARTRLPDGGVLLTKTAPSGREESLVRLNPDGTPDEAFGTEGVSSPFPFNASTISVGRSGSILVGGYIDKSFTGMHGNPSVFLVETFVARFTADGQLDSSFATEGVANLYVAGAVEGRPRQIQEGSDGGVWFSALPPKGHDVLVGLTATGGLNTGFGAGGRVNAGGEVVSIHPLADGRVQAAVNRKGKQLGRFGAAESFFLLAYQPNGQEDTGYGAGKSPAVASGRGTTVLWGVDGAALAGVSMTHTSVACRSFYNACLATPVLARFTSTGQLDKSFGAKGTTGLTAMRGPANFAGMRSLAVRPGGGYLAAGTSGLQAFLVGVTEDGTLDPSFGGGGLVTTSTRQESSNFADVVATDPRGRIVVAGHGNADAVSSFPSSGLLVRLRPNGSLDRRFAGGRSVLRLPGETTALDVDRHSRSLVLQDEFPGERPDGSGVVRITAQGRIDRSYGKGGFAFPHLSATSVTALHSGAALIAGSDGGAATVVRLGARGRIDRSFGKGGRAAIGFGRGTCTVRDLAVQGDGRILIAGECSGRGEAMIVARLRPNGSLDTSFGRRGQLAALPGDGRSMATAIAVQRGKVLVAVRLTSGKRRSELLIRLNRDGRRDRTFARGGIARTPVPTPQELGVRACGPHDETASILPTGNRILLVHNGTGPPVLAFRQDGKRDRSLHVKAVAPDRQIAPDCFAGPFGARQDGSAVIAWSKRSGNPWEIALQRLEPR